MSNFTSFRSTTQFECGGCDHIGYADVRYHDDKRILHCEACCEVLTDLDNDSDEFSDFDAMNDFDDDGFDYDYGEVD